MEIKMEIVTIITLFYILYQILTQIVNFFYYTINYIISLIF